MEKSSEDEHIPEAETVTKRGSKSRRKRLGMDVTEGYGEELGISKQNEEVKSAPLAKRSNHVFEPIASLSSRKRVRAKVSSVAVSKDASSTAKKSESDRQTTWLNFIFYNSLGFLTYPRANTSPASVTFLCHCAALTSIPRK
jgi:hypothetical protein